MRTWVIGLILGRRELKKCENGKAELGRWSEDRNESKHGRTPRSEYARRFIGKLKCLDVLREID